ncbi:MAG: tyrosine-type recombinase/integrase [Ignavibacteriales bacterium]|nr:tyrosine-type recombinase/integrase [Ignavibacteriales bacterium]
MSKIRKLENGGYRVDVTTFEGIRLRPTFPRKEDASDYIATIEKEKLDFKLERHGVRRRKIKFSDAIDSAILEKKSLANKSYVKYKYVFETLLEFADANGLKHINEFTTSHADEFKKVLMQSNASPKTINFYLTAIKSLFKEHVLRDIILKNPFDSVKLERVKQKTLLEREEDYYDTSEITAFFLQEMDPKFKIAFIGLFLTGMRVDEFINLTWERVDWKNKLLQIRSVPGFVTKNASSERDIPMSNVLFQVVKSLKESTSSEYIFVHPKGKKLSEKTMLSACKKIAKKAKIKKNATNHKWRHSFNSHLSQQGVDYSARQYLMGHKPQSMTDHYTKVDPKKLHEVISKLDSLINY